MHTIIRLISTLVIVSTSGLALDPNLATSSIIRTDFTVESGLPSNVVNAIVQTRNGFLWVGTDSGLARFNGRQFLPIYFRFSPPAPQGVVQALAESLDGALWVGTGAGVVRIARPALDFFDRSLSTIYHLGPGSSDEVTCILATRSGELWVGTNDGLYRLKRGIFVCVWRGVFSQIKEAADGHLLIVMHGRLVEWNGRRIVEHPEIASRLGIGTEDFIDVLQDRAGTTWICTLGGLAKKDGKSVSKFYGFTGPNILNTHRVYVDPQGSVWVQFSDRLCRVAAAKPRSRDILLVGAARAIVSDREGDLWVGTNGDGLMRFKKRVITMFTKQDGLPNDTTMTVLSRKNGSIWVGNNCAGLSVLEHGRFRTYAEKDGLSNSCVWSLAEDQQENLWIGTWGGGVFRLKDGHFTQFSKVQGLSGNIVRAIMVARDDSLWFATDLGVSHLLHNTFHNYAVNDGLSSDRVLDVHEDRDGRIWVATSTGVDQMSGERFVSVTSTDKIIDSHSIHFAESRAGELYTTGAPKGLNLVRKGHILDVEPNLDLLGMDAFRQDVWFSSINGIFRFAGQTLTPGNRERETPIDYTSFGVADGMNTTQCSIGTPNMTITPDGKLWVATVKGLAELNPSQLPMNSGKPAIWISEITIGRVKQIGGRELTLPPGTHHTELHFDSVSLTSPEKIRFQYRLEGIDSVWLDADRSLTAVYTSVPLGTHIFHVRACNADGIWDPVGIAYQVTQQPYVYETTWFRLAAGAVLALLLAGLYRLRLKQIADQYSIRLDERVAERTRIARELHDTLLQSFHGLLLRFQSVQNMLPPQLVEAKESLEIAIGHASEAITEGRDAVQELRVSRRSSNDLVEVLRAMGQEVGADLALREIAKAPLVFRVLVEGKPQLIDPSLRDDIYRIAREALRNAFLHAQAKQIEVDVRYGRRTLRLRIRDDGIGMSPTVMARGGREGHWGLTGMRERAKKIHGRLEIWSEPRRGTEVELTIPAAISYRNHGYSHTGED